MKKFHEIFDKDPKDIFKEIPQEIPWDINEGIPGTIELELELISTTLRKETNERAVWD